MANVSFFDWECFYHVEDFAYCLSQTWIILLAIYLTEAFLVGLFLALLVHLRRRQKIRYSQRLAAERSLYDGLP